MGGMEEEREAAREAGGGEVHVRGGKRQQRAGRTIPRAGRSWPSKATQGVAVPLLARFLSLFLPNAAAAAASQRRLFARGSL
jgi:hypothetical protein